MAKSSDSQLRRACIIGSLLTRLPLIVVLLTFAFTAQSVSAAPTDACSLLTSAQVSAVLGVQVGEPKHPFPNSTTTCEWDAASSGKGMPDDVAISLITPQQFAMGKIQVHRTTKTPASGTGDDATYIKAGALSLALEVLKGSNAISLRLRSSAPESKIMSS